jgi:hypothetical protein
VEPERHQVTKTNKLVLSKGLPKLLKGKEPFFGFSRTEYGMVRLRTNGKRLLVMTDSAKLGLKEAYAYTLTPGCPPAAAQVLQA